MYQEGNNVSTAFELSWIAPTNISSFRVQYRFNGSNWTTFETTSPSTRINNLTAGILEIQIQTINNVGKASAISPASFTLAGKTAIPGDVQNLTLEPISANTARLRWDQARDLDVAVGGSIYIRHSSLNTGLADWSDAVDLIPAKSGSATEAIVPLIEGEIFAKFQDDGGRQSANAASVIIDLPDALGILPVQVQREDETVPPFQGSKNTVFYSDEFDALCLDGDTLIDSIPDFDAILVMDYTGNIFPFGTYYFANQLDFGRAYAVDLQRYFVTHGFFPSDLIDSKIEDIDIWADFDGNLADTVNAKLLLRATNDDPAGTPTWGAWQEFVNGTFNGRGFEFKAELYSGNQSQNIIISELGYSASLQQRTEQSVATIASGAGTKTVTFDKAFYTAGGTTLPSVGITAQNMTTGDYFTIGTVTDTNFTVTFRNSTGTAIDRNFTYTATGYGRAV